MIARFAVLAKDYDVHKKAKTHDSKEGRAIITEVSDMMLAAQNTLRNRKREDARNLAIEVNVNQPLDEVWAIHKGSKLGSRPNRPSRPNRFG